MAQVAYQPAMNNMLPYNPAGSSTVAVLNATKQSPYYTPASREPTPPSSALSPTGQHLTMAYRPHHEPRRPLYVPAALRRTDHPTRPTKPTAATNIPRRPRAPDTPPSSKESSYKRYQRFSSDGKQTDHSTITLVEELSLEHDLSGASAVTERLDLEFSVVEGPPPRGHWKPDVSSDRCFLCSTTFSWFFRRHHCRHCGELICEDHFGHTVPLDHNARFHSKGFDSKACTMCFEEWEELKACRVSRQDSLGDVEQAVDDQPDDTVGEVFRKAQRNRRVSTASDDNGMVWSTF